MLLDRLRNDVTRLAAVKAFTTIARSPLHIDLSSGGQPLPPGGRPGSACSNAAACALLLDGSWAAEAA